MFFFQIEILVINLSCVSTILEDKSTVQEALWSLHVLEIALAVQSQK